MRAHPDHPGEKEKGVSRLFAGYGQTQVQEFRRPGKSQEVGGPVFKLPPGFQKRSIIFSSAAIQRGCSFNHGICVYSFPPAEKNILRPRMPISSRVSRQSEPNAGQMTRRFLTPRLGNSASSKSVYGFSQG